MNETEYSINSKQRTEQCTKYMYSETVLQNDSQGRLKGGICKQTKGDCPDRVHSDQMVLRIVRQAAGPR